MKKFLQFFLICYANNWKKKWKIAAIHEYRVEWRGEAANKFFQLFWYGWRRRRIAILASVRCLIVYIISTHSSWSWWWWFEAFILPRLLSDFVFFFIFFNTKWLTTNWLYCCVYTPHLIHYLSFSTNQISISPLLPFF